ncbi:MAG: TetR/AcrR family transcriptional repressor of nem operon [Planctomycetota bacterium]
MKTTYHLVGFAPVSERKQQILATAADILEHKSFAAFSYQDLADRLGIRKASIHHHFKSKNELGIELLKFFQARSDALMTDMLADAESPGAALRMVFEMCEKVMFDGETKVCPSCAFEVDAKNLSPAMIDMLRESTESFQQQLASLLAAARTGGEIAFLGDVQDQAATIVSALQGARIAEPIMGREHFRGVVRQLRRSLGL